MIRDNRNFVQFAFEIIKPQLINYIQSSLVNFYGPDWLNKMKVDNIIDSKILDELYNQNIFHKNSDVKYLLGIFSYLFEPIFQKNLSNKYTFHICELILFHYSQWVYNYKFNNRETYKVIEMIQSFMEELGMNIFDINILRNEMLYIAAVETFGEMGQNIQLPSLESLYQKYSSDFHSPVTMSS